MKEQQHIEELFKKSFEKFEVDPGVDTWSAIKSQLPSTPAGISNAAGTSQPGFFAANSSWILSTFVAASIIGLSLVGYFAFNKKAEELNQEIKKEIPVLPAKVEQTPQEENSVNTSEIEVQTAEEEKVKEISTPEAPVARKEMANPKVNLPKENSKATTENLPTEEKSIESSIISSEITETKVEQNHAQVSTQSKPIPTIEQKSTSNSNTTESRPSEIVPSTTEKELDLNLILPNVFTPNGDGVNDVFLVIADEADNIEVKVFSKSGSLIHSWVGVYGFWDGKLPDGSDAPNDKYIYQLIVHQNGKQMPKQGLIELLR